MTEPTLQHPITVIDLWPHWVTCARCQKDTLDRNGWPFYEEFLHPDDANPDGYYTSVCNGCAAWLQANSATLWLRTPKPVPSS